ncbi:hypothetical protein OB905_00410 [Halobacteria archaeon AArc-dxtr1]|nr:hypothetical protein [Halobacteria archaeon AArc-dxtr1]
MTDLQPIINNLQEERQRIITIRKKIPTTEYERINHYQAAEGRIRQAIEALEEELEDE